MRCNCLSCRAFLGRRRSKALHESRVKQGFGIVFESESLLMRKQMMAETGHSPSRVDDRSGLARSFALAAALALVLSGCTSVVSVDMQADREANLAMDRELINPPADIDLTQPFSLDDVIKLGLRNNLDLRVSRFEQEIAKDTALADKLDMLPDLQLNREYDHEDKFRREGSFAPETGVVTEGATVSRLKTNMTADLTLTWSVLDFGLSYIRSRQSQLQQEVLQMRRNRQAQLLALDLTEAFWKAALAEDALDYVRRVERELKAQRGAIEQSVAERRLDAIAAKDVEKRLVDIALSIRDLQADIANARIRLSRLMGLKQDARFILKREPIKPLLAKFPRPDQLSADVFEEYALRNRPELFERDLGERIQSDDVRAAMLNMFPNLSFSAGRNWDGNTLVESNYWNSVGYSVGWNLLNLPKQYSLMKSEEKGVEMERASRLQMTVGVITQVHIGLLDYRIAVERFKLYEESYGLTTELLGMTRERNAAGIMSDLSVAQRLLEDMAAKLRRDQAVVDLIVAYRRLLTSVGLNPHQWNTALVELGIEQEQIGPREGAAPTQPGASSGQDVDELLKSYGLDAAPQPAPVPAPQSRIEGMGNAYGLSQGGDVVNSGLAMDMSGRNGVEMTSVASPAYDAATLNVSDTSDQRTELVGLARVEEQATANLKMVVLSSNGWVVKVDRAQSLKEYLLIMKQARQLALKAIAGGEDDQDALYRMRATQKSLIDGGLEGLTEVEARSLCDELHAAGMGCQAQPST